MATKRLENWQPADPVRNGRAPLGTERQRMEQNWKNAMTPKVEIVSDLLGANRRKQAANKGGETVKARSEARKIEQDSLRSALADFRERTKMSTHDIGLACGLSQNMIASFLRRDRAISDPKKLKAIEHLIGVGHKQIAPDSSGGAQIHKLTSALNKLSDDLSKTIRMVRDLQNVCAAQEEAINELLGRTNPLKAAASPRPWWKFWGVR